MSLVGIRNGLWNHLTACGPYDPEAVSTCDFGIMESCSSACAVLFWPGTDTNIDPDRFSANPRNFARDWDIRGEIYIRYSGDPKFILSSAWQAHDDLFNTVSKDDTLGNSCKAAQLVSMSYNVREAVESGGHVWSVVRWRLTAEEF